jgi:hypothetical protein
MAAKEILVWSPQAGPRLRYALAEVLGRLLGWTWELTTDPGALARWPGPKFSYGPSTPANDAPLLLAHGLLAEEGVRELPLSSMSGPGFPLLFPVRPGGMLSYDPLAAAFFLLSRYEEYSPYVPEAHGRYPAHQSWAWRAGCLQQPVVVYWARQLGEALRERFPALPYPPRRYTFQPTYDVDMPWAFAHPGLRGLARAVLDAGLGRFEATRLRWQVWTGQRPDPFFFFPRLRAWHEGSGLPATFFFLLSGSLNRYDVNPAAWRPVYRQLIRSVGEWAAVGLHPSYFAGERPGRLRRERQRLEGITGRPVTWSRQHFLRLTLPDTYRHLLAAGLTQDYSMGYAEAVGFRAGTTEPFLWYDLLAEAPTSLLLVPFAAMDVTLRQYLGQSPAEAGETLQSLQATCRGEGLRFTTLWHNSSFSASHGWEGWEEVYHSLFS